MTRKGTTGKELVETIRGTVNSPKFGCEVGVWKGFTSRALLRQFKNLILLMVDRYEAYDVGGRGAVSGQAKIQDIVDSAMSTAIERTSFAKDRRIMLMADSVLASKLVPDSFFDFVFIDANHSYESARDDINAWYPKVKAGGLVSGHDYTSLKWGVKQAVDEFIENNRYDLNVTSSYHQIWWFIKGNKVSK